MRRFGWLETPYQLTGSRFQIEPLDNNEESDISAWSDLLADGWMYRPLEKPRGGKVPLIPCPRIQLPVTHCLELDPSILDETIADFIILVFGWLLGLHLVPEGCGHMNKVAIKEGKLVDFWTRTKDIPRMLDTALDFYVDPAKCKAPSEMYGAIHWYLVSQSQEYFHQQIFGQYMVLDALFHVHKNTFGVPSKFSHAKRIVYLAEKYEVVLPSWAEVGEGRDSQLSIARNEYFHEAKFGSAPIGYAFPSILGELLNEFPKFNSRLIAAMLGAVGSYSRSSTQTRQRHMFDLD